VNTNHFGEIDPEYLFSLETNIPGLFFRESCGGLKLKLLKEKIQKEGVILSESVLKVDSFLNHQIDPDLMVAMGKEYYQHFSKGKKVTKVLTIESSGIAVGLTTALEFGVPLVFARKKKSLTMNNDVYVSKVYSFTKQETNEITVSKKFLSADDHVLIIDDFLANGEAALGLASIVQQAGASLEGIGIVIEKAFQDGGQKLRNAGFHVHSLAQIIRLDHKKKKIEFREEAFV